MHFTCSAQHAYLSTHSEQKAHLLVGHFYHTQCVLATVDLYPPTGILLLFNSNRRASSMTHLSACSGRSGSLRGARALPRCAPVFASPTTGFGADNSMPPTTSRPGRSIQMGGGGVVGGKNAPTFISPRLLILSVGIFPSKPRAFPTWAEWVAAAMAHSGRARSAHCALLFTYSRN